MERPSSAVERPTLLAQGSPGVNPLCCHFESCYLHDAPVHSVHCLNEYLAMCGGYV